MGTPHGCPTNPNSKLLRTNILSKQRGGSGEVQIDLNEWLLLLDWHIGASFTERWPGLPIRCLSPAWSIQELFFSFLPFPLDFLYNCPGNGYRHSSKYAESIPDKHQRTVFSTEREQTLSIWDLLDMPMEQCRPMRLDSIPLMLHSGRGTQPKRRPMVPSKWGQDEMGCVRGANPSRRMGQKCQEVNVWCRTHIDALG